MDPASTLIFFDEIQASQRAVTSIKYFYEELPEYNIVSAGFSAWSLRPTVFDYALRQGLFYSQTSEGSGTTWRPRF